MEEPEFNIGDWVTIIPGKDFSFHKGNNTFKIGFVSKNFVCETNKDQGNGVFLPRLRKALPHEIPNYELKYEVW